MNKDAIHIREWIQNGCLPNVWFGITRSFPFSAGYSNGFIKFAPNMLMEMIIEVLEEYGKYETRPHSSLPFFIPDEYFLLEDNFVAIRNQNQLAISIVVSVEAKILSESSTDL